MLCMFCILEAVEGELRLLGARVMRFVLEAEKEVQHVL